jgi:hypothetical protein
MNTKDWLKLNPNHRVTLSAEPGDLVRAEFRGGEGVDRRFSGVGAHEEQACDRGLEARAAIKSALP